MNSDSPAHLSGAEQEPIVASFVWTPEEATRGARAALRAMLGWKWWGIIGLGSVLVMAYVYGLATGSGAGFRGLFLLGLGVTMLASMTVLGPFQARRQHASHPSANRRILYRFGDAGVTAEVEGVSRVETRWEGFVRVVRAREGFLLQHSPNVYDWLPSSAFASPDDVERFATLAASRVDGYTEAKPRSPRDATPLDIGVDVLAVVLALVGPVTLSDDPANSYGQREVFLGIAVGAALAVWWLMRAKRWYVRLLLIPVLTFFLYIFASIFALGMTAP